MILHASKFAREREPTDACFQRNPGQRTIEEELEKGLHAAGAIATCNFGDLKKVSNLRSIPLHRARNSRSSTLCTQ
jgi:hypothetical protein